MKTIRAFRQFLVFLMLLACAEKPGFDPSSSTDSYQGNEESKPEHEERAAADSSPAPMGYDFLSERQQLEIIKSDRETLNARDLPRTRYFSLAAVANQGHAEGVLEAQRINFQKILNLMSAKNVGVKAIAIEPGRRLFRVHLEDLGLSTLVFDKAIADHYPFGQRYKELGTDESRRAEILDSGLRKYYETGNYQIRMDWWNGTALLPEFFAKLKTLPPEEMAELEKKMEKDPVLLAGFRFYNRPLKRSDITVELGLSVLDMAQVLRDGDFAATLNALNSKSGTISRGFFQTFYPKIMARFRQDLLLQEPLVGDFLETADCISESSCELKSQRQFP